MAYKSDIDDERESPALEIMDLTTRKGGIVHYHDHYVPAIKTHKGLSCQSVRLTPEVLSSADCVVLTTNHKVFDVKMIQQNVRLIVD